MFKCFRRQESRPGYLKRTKIVVVGDGMCGKTCLINRFIHGSFCEDLYESTLYQTESALIQHDSKPVELILCDTAGQEDFSCLRPRSYAGSDVIIICFSVDHPDSLDNVACSWQPEVSHYCENTPILLVGTKIDLRNEHLQRSSDSMEDTMDKMLENEDKFVDFDQGQAMAKLIGAVGYMECSAKCDIGVQGVFREATRIALLKNRKRKGKR